MFQKIILIGIIITLPFCSISQLSVGYRFGIGNHGVNFEPGTLEKNQKPYLRSSNGIVIIFNNVNNAGLQLEVNFAQKGWFEKIDSLENAFFKRQIDYIEIPIYSHFEIGRRMIRPIIIAGPYIGFKINDQSTHSNFDQHINRTAFNTYVQKARSVDLGIKAGLGFRVNIGKKLALFGEVHYDLEIAGGQDIFIEKPDKISASRLTEISGVFGILWHIIPQKKKQKVEGYTPKEHLYDTDFVED